MWLFQLLISALIGYLLGSFPTGYVLVRLIKGVDIRQYGSGKTGGTNVARLLGPRSLLPIALGDMGKTMLAVLLARWWFADPTMEAVAGLFGVMGHNWPLYIGFRGGSGVGSALAVMLLFSLPISLAVFFLFLLVLLIFRYVSLSSVVSSLAAAVLMIIAVVYWAMPPAYLLFIVPAAILILVRHRANMQRILAGTEHRIGTKRPADESSPVPVSQK